MLASEESIFTLACFGPALQKFSEHWPLRRGTPRPQPEAKKRRKQAEMFEEPWDPYEVTPEDALDAARREVKNWRLQQLTHMKARTDLDPLTSFYVLAWDAFRAPKFDYDEALRLARAVGVDLDKTSSDTSRRRNQARSYFGIVPSVLPRVRLARLTVLVRGSTPSTTQPMRHVPATSNTLRKC